ncbi:MAG: N-acetylmuramoyl-L-alanine amidase [Candidatus Eisenbacteria bacterium]
MNGFNLSRPAILAGWILLLHVCVWGASANAAVEVQDVRTGVTPERTRIVLDLASEGFTWRVAEQTARGAVVLFANVRLSGTAPSRIENVGRLASGRLAAEGDAGLRLALQFEAASDLEIFTLANPPRWVLDVQPPSGRTGEGEDASPTSHAEKAEPGAESHADSHAESQTEPHADSHADRPAESPKESRAAEKAAPQESTTPSGSAAVEPDPAGSAPDESGDEAEVLSEQLSGETAPIELPPATELLPEPERRGPRVVVIDAGHGGEDPGATGPGLREKDVCLDVARRLHRTLSAMEGVHPVLTRSRDVIVPLRQRMKLAEDVEADLFVSIHVNAAEASDAHGVEVFFLSLRGASDEASRELAKAENAALVAPGSEATDSSQELPFSLSLRQSDTLIRSSLAAESVLNSFVGQDLAENRGVRQAAFVVLKSVQVPSILVELGFASSAIDREKLKKETHRQQLADALGQGVKAYFDRFAPERNAN